MMRKFVPFSLMLLLALSLASGGEGARRSARWDPEGNQNRCPPRRTAVIDAEARCFEHGVAIGFYGTDGVKVACMENRQVQTVCGPDGQLTRLRAYALWFNSLKRFEAECAAQGGAFSFEDPRFTEPNGEHFCLQAQPEIGANMFEEPLCNFRSLCPAVTVACDFDCQSAPVAFTGTPAGEETVFIPSAGRR